MEEEHHHEVHHHKKKNVLRGKGWVAVSGVLVLLLIISIFTDGFSFGGGSGIISSEDQIIFMNSDACTDVCDEMEPVVKETAEKTGMGFSKIKYSQPVEIAGYVLISDGVLSINGIQDEASFKEAMCSVTSNEEICDEVETLKSKQVESRCDDMEKKDKPVLKTFVMSFCPYGQQAIKLVKPVVDAFEDKAVIEPHFVIYEDYCSGGRCNTEDYCEDGINVCSMHGLGELHEDMRMKCIFDSTPDKFWDYSICISDTCTSRDVDECWEQCAEKYEIDIDDIKNCQEEDGIELMEAEKKEMAEYNVRGSEALVLNDDRLEMADYRWDPDKLKDLMCCGFDEKPEECDETIAGAASEGPASGSCS